MARKRKEKVVIVLDDGSRLRGALEDFRPSRTTLQLKELDPGGGLVQIHDVDARKVAAIFFVQDLGLIGDSRKGSTAAPDAVRKPENLRRVTFTWGEKVDAYVQTIDAARRWMYLYPHEGDDRSDNINRIYATGSGVLDIRPVPGS